MKTKYKSTVSFLLTIFIVGVLTVPGLRAQSKSDSLADYQFQAIAFTNNLTLNSPTSKLATLVELKEGTYRLGNLINIIASQAKLKPSYSKEFVPVNKRVKMPKLKVTAAKALRKALQGISLGFKVKAGSQLVFVKKEVNKFKIVQETVTGTVTSASTDKPLIGVSILVKGTSTGTTTNTDGHYSITVSSLQDTLIFSYIGFKQAVVPIDGRTNINVQLKPTTASLNQLVVVGYGQKKRADLTSAIATVDVETALHSRPVSTVANALQGKVAGLTVTHSSGKIGVSPSITLRGVTGSLNASGAHPLILVDGVQVPSLSLVNPHSIKSISVLKDAAATAIYGNRAAFGVILIKTKDGVKGQEPVISYNGSFSLQTPTVLPTIAPAPAGARMALLALQRTHPHKKKFGVIGMYFSEKSIKRIKQWKKKYGDMDLGREMVKGRDFEVIDGKLFSTAPGMHRN